MKPAVIVAVGSFSPITFLHLRLFEMAKDRLLDASIQVIGGFITPVNDAYQKPGLISSRHRLEMCRLALSDHPWVQLDGWEASQSRWMTTVEVLESLRRRLKAAGYEQARIMLLAGADLIASFRVPGLWLAEDQETILERYGLVIIDRPGTDLSEDLLANPILYKHRVRVFEVKQHIFNDVSSTKVRLLVSRGLSVRYLVPDTVLEYITEHNLYQ